MARTRGLSITRNPDRNAPEWEPEPLHLPLYVPVPIERHMPQTSGDEAQERSPRVIVIDLV